MNDQTLHSFVGFGLLFSKDGERERDREKSPMKAKDEEADFTPVIP